MNAPEGCKLIADWAGEGWVLSVQNSDGDTIAYLAWPENWPEKMTSDELEKYGFEIT